MAASDAHSFAKPYALKRALAVGIAVLGLQFGFLGQPSAKAETVLPDTASASAAKIIATTTDYVATFYPLWFTNYQWSNSSVNRFIGPKSVTPLYRVVVVINVDTLYASSVISLEYQPLVVRLPSTNANYSILTLDPYGSVFETGIEPEAGSYVLTGPDYDAGVPAGLTEIKMPLNTSFLIIRADKYSSSGQDQSKAADKFRKALATQTLSDFVDGETPESTLILPVETFGLPFKSTADAMMKYTPIAFLKLLQTSVHSSITPTLSKANQKLSDKFDSLFDDGNVDLAEKLEFAAGVILSK